MNEPGLFTSGSFFNNWIRLFYDCLVFYISGRNRAWEEQTDILYFSPLPGPGNALDPKQAGLLHCKVGGKPSAY